MVWIWGVGGGGVGRSDRGKGVEIDLGVFCIACVVIGVDACGRAFNTIDQLV